MTPAGTDLPHNPLPSVGVVIVNYCSYDLTLQCVESLLAQAIAPAHQIVVVDNASPDGSGILLRQALPTGVVSLLSLRNGGFGAGVNLGVDALRTDLVLVLNPDTRFEDNQIWQLQALFAENERLGVAGLNLLNTDGTPQHSARRFYSLLDVVSRRTPLGRLQRMKALEETHLMTDAWRHGPFEADWVIGGGLVVRRTAFERVGCMDEAYFLYFEEVDLCARMWLHGWKVMAVPGVRLFHDHQRASGLGLMSASGKTHLRSMFRFFGKFGMPWWRRPSREAMSVAYSRWSQRDVVAGLPDPSSALQP